MFLDLAILWVSQNHILWLQNINQWHPHNQLHNWMNYFWIWMTYVWNRTTYVIRIPIIHGPTHFFHRQERQKNKHTAHLAKSARVMESQGLRSSHVTSLHGWNMRNFRSCREKLGISWDILGYSFEAITWTPQVFQILKPSDGMMAWHFKTWQRQLAVVFAKEPHIDPAFGSVVWFCNDIGSDAIAEWQTWAF